MVLESCMILLDNSEYMRNGDYVPSRLEAQHDAANLVAGAKTQSNRESTVGVIAMTGEPGMNFGGGGAELLISPTKDMGKILGSLHAVPIRGNVCTSGGKGGEEKKDDGGGGKAMDGTDIAGAIQVASLALKHRQNKNGSQRIVAFVGSPLSISSSDIRTLTKCGRQLKKNNVYIDVVCLGELEGNEPLLKELVDAANGTTAEGGERTCHLVTIPPGVLPSDVLVTSPIIHPGGVPPGMGGGDAGLGGGGGAAAGGGGGGGGGGGANAFAEYGGVDPELDPELAMALRVSMEEERQRQERLAAAEAARQAAAGEGGEAKEGEEGKTEEGKTDAMAEDETPAAAAGGGGGSGGAEEGDEDALLQQALAMSMQEDRVASGAAAAAAPPAAAAAMDVEEDEDAAMQMALQMSMKEDKAAAAAEGGTTSEKKEGEGGAAPAAGATGQFQDQQFVNQLLGSLPGVDPSDPAIQEALRNLQNQQGGDKKEEGGGGEGEGKEKE